MHLSPMPLPTIPAISTKSLNTSPTWTPFRIEIWKSYIIIIALTMFCVLEVSFLKSCFETLSFVQGFKYSMNQNSRTIFECYWDFWPIVALKKISQILILTGLKRQSDVFRNEQFFGHDSRSYWVTVDCQKIVVFLDPVVFCQD